MILEVKNLKTFYEVKGTDLQAVNGVSFELKKGEVLGLVGESGSGKSTIADTIMQILPENGRIVGGKVLFKGRDLLTLEEKQVRNIRWKEISLVTQNAMNSLNPAYRIEDQIIEALETHIDISDQEAKDRARELFEIVGLDKELVTSYPHEFSGGMKQRSIIAMALALDPSLIIMDEPTTGLDVLVQDKILRTVADIRESIQGAMLLITHDMPVVAEMSDKAAVMYAGYIMEYSGIVELFQEPYHPYSLGLQRAFPNIRDLGKELISLPGSPPNLVNPPAGCPFAERCPFSAPKCQQHLPSIEEVDRYHFARCHFVEKAPEFRETSKSDEIWQ